MKWDFPDPFLVPVQVSDSDIDLMGHANNCEYLRWLEKAAWAHSNALGLDWDAYQCLQRGMVALHTELDYLAACYAGDELTVGTWIVENDQRLGIRRQYQIIRVSDGVTVLRGHTRFVCVELASGKPRRMPVEFINGYAVTAVLPDNDLN